MAEQIISPGVFTRENDLSFLPQGVGQIGAAIIGPTVKGPAFVPTVVRSFAEYERRFGPLSKDTFVPQTVREYLRNAGSVTVCRVLAGGGYTFTGGTNEFVALLASGSSYVSGAADTQRNVLLGVIFPSKADTTSPDLKDTTIAGKNTNGAPAAGTGIAGDLNEDFSLTLQGTGVTTTQFSASLDPSKANYIFKQLGNNPNNSKNGAITYTGTPGYTYLNFKSLQTSIQNTTAESATITLANPTSHLGIGVIPTGSISSSFGAFFFATPDGVEHTVAFSCSLGNTLAAVSGSSTFANIGTSGFVPAGMVGISSSNAAQILMTAFNTITNVTASFSSNVVTITMEDAGNVISGSGANWDLSTTFPAASASISVTQGTNVTGYHQLSSGDSVALASVANAKTLVFNGNLGQTEGYSYASTPFITSQFLDSNKTVKSLFKFHTLVHGKVCNKDYKISIANLKEPSDIDGVEQYSTFSVLVRKYSDTDKNPVILEQFNNCSLDPDSTNFISRKIGDRYPQYNDTLGKVELLGAYSNISEYIRVEVSQPVAERSVSPKLSPKGFNAVFNPIATASLNIDCIFPSASYEGEQKIGTLYNENAYLGWKFNEKEADNENFIMPLPSTLENNISGKFNIENYSGHMSSSLWSGSLSASIDSTGINGPANSQLKFTVCFQGGEDGIAPYRVKFTGAESSTASNYETGANLFGFDVSSTTKAGYTGYKKAIDILSNQDEYDINMVVLPGVVKAAGASAVTNAAIDMVEARGDAFYVMDLSIKEASVNTAISNASGLDTNYAAVYYPWVKVLDTAQNKPVLVPPSVIVPGAIAQSDNIAAEWFAPAGLNRGVLGNVIEAKIRLNQKERDKLYDAKINPIATFPQTGVCIWGQKTLQERSTALNRINVRRLLIALKKFIASSSRYLVFEQNTQATRNRFLNIVNPYLESVQQRQGLFAFRVQMDEANNTPEVIDRNQLVGAIYLQPTKTAEFIVLDFNVLPTGATFDTGGGGGGY